jgi:hypothetical protein
MKDYVVTSFPAEPLVPVGGLKLEKLLKFMLSLMLIRCFSFFFSMGAGVSFSF